MRRTTKTAPPPSVEQPATDPAGASTVTVLSGYMEPHQAAKELGISERTLARWTGRRCGHPRVLIGRGVMYQRSSIAIRLERQERDPAAEPPRVVGARDARCSAK